MTVAPDLAVLRGRLRFREPAAKHSAWRIGGLIGRLYEPVDRDDLLAFLHVLSPTEDIAWLGAGNNLLVRDAGFAGTVIAARRVFDTLHIERGPAVQVGSGVRLPKLARFCAQQGLGGVEQFATWPHTVGGALQRSVTRNQGSLWKLVEFVDTLDRHGCERRLTIPALRARRLPRDEWIVAARLRLTPNVGEVVSMHALSEQLRGARWQPLVTCRGPVFSPAAGRSVFELLRQAGVERASQGSATLHADDPNLVAYRHAPSVDDLEQLLDRIQKTVMRKLGVRLRPLVKFIGRSSRP